MQHSDYLENIPDSAKLIAAGVPPMASVLGLTVEEWSFVLSGILALMFIVEKLYRFYKWARKKKKDEHSSE